MFRANRAYDLHEEEVESAATKPEMYVEIELVHTKAESEREREGEHDKAKEETRQEHWEMYILPDTSVISIKKSKLHAHAETHIEWAQGKKRDRTEIHV